MNIAEIAPIGMLFVRSKDGISHNPLEYSSDEDIVVATNIFMIPLSNLLDRLLYYRRKPFSILLRMAFIESHYSSP